MTRKNRWRLIVYFPLLAALLFFLMIPYCRQMVFGPKIKGEPLWVWQQEFRAMAGDDTPPGIWSKVCHFFGVSDQPVAMVGGFPHRDETMRPVLMSMIDDPVPTVRSQALMMLCWLECTKEAVDAWERATTDSNRDVRSCAASALCEHFDQSATALPSVRKLLADSDELVKITAATFVLKGDSNDKQATDAMNAIFAASKDEILRWRAITCLAEADRENDAMLRRVVDLCHHEPSQRVRFACMTALGHFGKKAIPNLAAFLGHPHGMARLQSLAAVSMLKTDAAELVPIIERMSRSDPEETLRSSATAALHEIDPKRFPKTPPANLEP
jgi:HEAT repeat protein